MLILNVNNYVQNAFVFNIRKNTLKNLAVKGYNVCNLLSNDSKKIYRWKKKLKQMVKYPHFRNRWRAYKNSYYFKNFLASLNCFKKW